MAQSNTSNSIDPSQVQWDAGPAIDPGKVRWDMAPASRREPSPPTAIDRTARVAGLGSRAIISGLAGLPVLLGEGVNQLYNLGAGALGAEPRSSVLEGFNTFLTNAGLPEPSTPVERVSSAVTSGLAGAGGQLSTIAQAAPSVARETLLQAPIRQVIGGGTAGAASSLTAEAGGGPLAQFGAGMLGGMVPFAPQMANRAQPQLRETAVRAREAGFKVPPGEMESGLTSQYLEGFGGKVLTAQKASTANQQNVNRLVRDDFNLPAGTPLTERLFAGIRQRAGQAYQAVENLGSIPNDPASIASFNGLRRQTMGGVTTHPADQQIDDLITRLSSNQRWDGRALVSDIRNLREQGNANIKAAQRAGGDIERSALGSVQVRASGILEDMAERSLSANGAPADTIRNLRQARVTIAKAHSAENALTEGRGDVSARDLGRELNRGAPMTGGMRQSAEFATNFSKSSQDPFQMGSVLPMSPWDMLNMGTWGAGGAMATGTPSGALLGAIPLLARPAARSLVLSEPYQNFISPTLSSRDATLLGILSGMQGNAP